MTVLLAFAPFLTFALLERVTDAHIALVAVTVVSALLIVRDTVIRRRSLKLLEVGSLLLFGALAVASGWPGFGLSVVGVRLWVDSGLLAIVLASLLVGRPFTLQYARERVAPEIAAGPTFKSTNVKLSALWAAAFAVVVAADAAMLYVPGVTRGLGTLVIVAALAAAVLLTGRLSKPAVGRVR